MLKCRKMVVGSAGPLCTEAFGIGAILNEIYVDLEDAFLGRTNK